MKYKALSISRLLFVFCVLSVAAFIGGCSDDDKEELTADYGYAQFKLFKASSLKSTSNAEASEIQYLGDAEKMKIVLTNNQDGTEVTQTLALNPMSKDAELGLRSEKLRLMAGSYNVVGFFLYKAKGENLELILSGELSEKTTLEIVNGGMTVQDIAVKVVERGNLQLSLIKKMVAANRSAGNADKFVFRDVSLATITIQDAFTGQKIEFKQIPFKYTEMLDETSRFAVAKSDSLLSVRAGDYKIVSYVLYDKSKKTLDADYISEEAVFTVEDDRQTKVDVPVNIYQSAAYIKDYVALKQIWEALDGKNWSYSGTSYPMGANWDFDKDIDMWGQQYGVGLDGLGRITALNLGSFGPRGFVPDAIGQLTELKILTLGTHSDQTGDNLIEQWTGKMSDAQKLAWRNDYYNKFVKKDARASFSDALKYGFELQGNPVAETMSRQRSGMMRDAAIGSLSNGITGVSKEISKLTKLQQLFIANGKFVDFEPATDFSAFNDLTDVEIYNCPSMLQLPAALFTMPNIELLNLASNAQIESSVLEQGIDQLANAPVATKLQILYLGFNKLTTLPESVRNFKKLGKLDCINNQLKTIPAFGKDVKLVQLTMDYNQIEVVPNIDGYFCGIEDIESISFSHNKIKEFPNIFDANTIYGMGSVDFSFNEIESFEDGDNFRGVYTKTLVLTGNRLKEFPGLLFNKNSNISELALSGNGIEEFADGALVGKYSYMLQSIDLTHNKLTKLPREFDAVTLPYLYGIDMSHNRFTSFPYAPLNSAKLTIYGLRYQRDANGNRTLREWPENIFTHPSLKAFYMGGNDLRKIEDDIVPTIRIFEIKDNPNISINVSIVCPYIKVGLFNLVYDRTQDIRGCDGLDLQ